MWLLGLLGLPWIRWLHRGGRPRQAVPVPHLGLWQGAAARLPAAAARQPPDPAWRRRALLAALLLLALAEPQWAGRQAAVTLWIDDSLSLCTREPQGTRLALGLAQAREVLAREGWDDVAWRTLGNPWQVLDAAATGLPTTCTLTSEPGPPPAALLDESRAHWLLTDGADAALLAWPAGRRPDRVLQVGSAVDNVGLQRMAARRQPADAGRYDLQLAVVNTGSSAQTRELRVSVAGGAEPLRQTLVLPPGSTRQITLALPAASAVEARLQPADVLAEDDQFVLDLAPLRRQRIAVDPACPAALAAAVLSHPALQAVPHTAADPDAALVCSAAAPPPVVPSLRVRSGGAPQDAPGPGLWAASLAPALRIDPTGPPWTLAAPLPVGAGDEVLLALGPAAALVRRAGTPLQIDTALALVSAAGRGHPDLPLLLDLMLGQLLGGPLLERMAVADRGVRASQVLPVADLAAVAAAASSPSPAVAPARPSQPAVAPLLGLAAAVCLWELAALLRQAQRLRGGAGRATPAARP
jgi:hypothetical protein